RGKPIAYSSSGDGRSGIAIGLFVFGAFGSPFAGVSEVPLWGKPFLFAGGLGLRRIVWSRLTEEKADGFQIAVVHVRQPKRRILGDVFCDGKLRLGHEHPGRHADYPSSSDP